MSADRPLEWVQLIPLADGEISRNAAEEFSLPRAEPGAARSSSAGSALAAPVHASIWSSTRRDRTLSPSLLDIHSPLPARLRQSRKRPLRIHLDPMIPHPGITLFSARIRDDS